MHVLPSFTRSPVKTTPAADRPKANLLHDPVGNTNTADMEQDLHQAISVEHSNQQGRIVVNGKDVSVAEAITLMFMEMAEVFSGLTQDKMAGTKAHLDQLKEARDYMAQMRNFKGDDKDTEMPQDMMHYLDDNKVKISVSKLDSLVSADSRYPEDHPGMYEKVFSETTPLRDPYGNYGLVKAGQSHWVRRVVVLTKEQWDIEISHLQGKMDSLSEGNQLDFIKLKSVMDKYREAIEGANSVIQKNDETLKSVLR